MIPVNLAPAEFRKAGGFGNYPWGSARKKAMLAWEDRQHNRLAG